MRIAYFKRSVQLACCGFMMTLAMSGCGEVETSESRFVKSNRPASGLLQEAQELRGLGNINIPIPQIPVSWTLKDVEGREVEATIIGKDATSIYIVRNSDGRRFHLPIARLSDFDRNRVGNLSDRNAPSSHPMESSFYRMKRASLNEVEGRIEEINRLMPGTDSNVRVRSYLSELSRLQAERVELEEELRDSEKY